MSHSVICILMVCVLTAVTLQLFYYGESSSINYADQLHITKVGETLMFEMYILFIRDPTLETEIR